MGDGRHFFGGGVTYAQFKRLQLRELNEFLTDAIAANFGNVNKTARDLSMRTFVLRRHVKRYGLVSGYGSRKPIRGDATQCRVSA